jgi:3-hydroxyacyl-[acyl-carrier-protein] dehydratase
VPAAFLFDLTNIDLAGTVCSPQRLGQINPQAGHMRQLDRVIWQNQDLSEALGVKQVRHDEFWVEGHIPGRPLLPGVLMIEAGAQLCSYLYRVKNPDAGFIGFTRCDDASFRGQVVPGDIFYVLAKEVEIRPRRFICRTQGVVGGRLVFEATITGMLI